MVLELGLDNPEKTYQPARLHRAAAIYSKELLGVVAALLQEAPGGRLSCQELFKMLEEHRDLIEGFRMVYKR
jgi:hypothetical protein